MNPTTDLATVPESALTLVRGGSFTVADLADAVTPAETEPKLPPFPALPKPVQLTDAARSAIGQVSKLFGRFQLTERRPLTDKELLQLTDEAVTIAEVTGPLAKRAEVIAEMVRVHMDATAEQATGKLGTGLRKVARIMAGKATGHYLLATPGSSYKVSVPGYAQSWEQRYVTGGAEIHPEQLAQMEADGTITREEYLGFTREVRAYDEDKVARFIRQSPARGLEILAAITTRKDPSAQLVSPKK